MIVSADQLPSNDDTDLIVIGGANGLGMDEWVRGLGPSDQPIEGLWACDADAASIMGEAYPGPGNTTGPAIVFGFRAVQGAFG